MYNIDKKKNEQAVQDLIASGYKDLGWANDGKEFSDSRTKKRQLDCSLYTHRGTHSVYIDDDNKEIIHVDSSD